jgi:prevent-host-death family protein
MNGATMKLSSQIVPISHLKTHAAEMFRQLSEDRQPLVITQNGEAKVVMQDVKSYEETQETLALLKILALGNRQIEQGKTIALDSVMARIRGEGKD